MSKELPAIIDLDFSIGEGVVEDLNFTSALASPYLKLFRDGAPIGQINYLFFESNKRYYIFGSLCYSPANRIIFFPGLRQREMLWYRVGPHSNPTDTRHSHKVIEHFTLEQTGERWHVKFYNTRKGLPSRPTLKCSDGKLFWFTISLRSPEVMQLLPRVTSWFFKSKKPDVERRTQILMDSRKSAIHHILQTASNTTISTDQYLNVEFYVDLQNNDTQPTNPVISPTPTLHGIPKSDANIEVRDHPVKMERFDGILWVRVSCLPGRFTDDAIITQA